MSNRILVKRHWWRLTAAGLLVLLVGLIIGDGADRRAADPTQPLMQNSTTTVPPPRTLKIGSFNIHGGKGLDGVRDLSRIADLLTDVDVAGLYEVRAIPDHGQSNQAAALGVRCNSGWIFAPAERQWWADYFGNGLIYRTPVHSFVRIPLTNTRGKAYRNALLSIAELEDATVRIIAVHIDRENDRRHQLQTVIDLFLGLQEPCLLMGDLNTPDTDAAITELRARPGVISPLHETLGEAALTNNIDWIFTRGLETVSAQLVDNKASDHPFLKAEFAPITP